MSDPLIEPVAPHRMNIWVERAIYAVFLSVIFIVLLFAAGAAYRIYFNEPPIVLVGMDGKDLGWFCQGEEALIHTHVSINDKVIIIYYVSTLDATGTYNIIGTQRAFTDILHPRPADFEQILPWTVPSIDPGHYRRVTAARNVANSQKTVWVESTYEIRKC